MPNHLAGESSRYLRQHAENPVDWYPWGEEAFAKARAEEKPIFLSIGYSACHWCHVMAHESFEDEATAALLNRHFISIKVDREERPDLDRVYMSAVQAITGGGGWPMSVFATPEGLPFYGGTYFPAQPRHGMPSFSQVLLSIVDAWNNKRKDLLEGGEQIVEMLEHEYESNIVPEAPSLSPKALDDAYKGLKKRFDPTHGGWGSAPKFPQPMVLTFLLQHVPDDSMITQTLEAMARGGIYDQLGGGFHRYAVDAGWVVPHFEKMLYDNAQLARVYLHASRATGSPLFRAITEETLDYVAREMLHPDGGFYATQDADTEGEEGKFFVWTPDQVREALGGPATRFLKLYGITERGNFEGQNVLTFNGTWEEREAIAGARQMLFEARDKRVHPGRDEKVLTSWNGLMLAAFADAARMLERADYLAIAQRNADFLLRELRTPAGRLFHVWKDGAPHGIGVAEVPGFLEDYTNLIEGLLSLYQADFNPRWYEAAQALADRMIAHFSVDIAETAGKQSKGLVYAGFYDTADDVLPSEALALRPRELQDNATPSGNAMAATVLLKLARLSGNPRYDALARQALAPMETMMGEHPLAFGQWLVAQDSALASSTEVAIVGDPDAEDVRALLAVAREGYHPHRLVAVGMGEVPPLLAERTQIEGQATAYVCREHVCQPPVTDPKALQEQIG